MPDPIVHCEGDDAFNVKQEILGKPGARRLSIRGASRVCGVHHNTLNYQFRALEGGQISDSKLAKKLIQQGFEGGQILSWKTEGVPAQALAVIVAFYAFEANNTTDIARAFALTLMTLTAEAFLAEQAGDVIIQVDPVAPVVQAPTVDAFSKAAARVKEVVDLQIPEPFYTALCNHALKTAAIQPPEPTVHEMTVWQIREQLHLGPEYGNAISQELKKLGVPFREGAAGNESKVYSVSDRVLTYLSVVMEHRDQLSLDVA